MVHFTDRVDAGRRLASLLMIYYADNPDLVVIGLPRGGVVIAREVAQALHVPFDVRVVRKIAAQNNPELAVGAITADGQVTWDESIIKHMHIDKDSLHDVIETEKREAVRRLALYKGNKPTISLHNKMVILVDDGVATGATILAALEKIHTEGATKIIIAVPVAPLDLMCRLEQAADHVICLALPRIFMGVSQFYNSFPQVTDEEVVQLLQK